MDQEQLSQFLRELAVALPNKAPDFSRPDIAYQWHRTLKEHLQTKAQCRDAFRVLTTKYDFFPSPRQIIEAVKQRYTDKDTNDAERRRQIAKDRYDLSVDRCGACNYTGSITAHDSSGASYAYRCPFCDTCELMGISKYVPLWADHYDVAKGGEMTRMMFGRTLGDGWKQSKLWQESTQEERASQDDGFRTWVVAFLDKVVR